VLSAPRQTPRLEDNPLSAVRDCLFDIFAATLYIGGRSFICNLRSRHAVVTGTHFPSSLLSKNIKNKIHRPIILPVVLCGCETWSLTLREESRLRMTENGVLRRIFEPKRYEATREWRKLHNEKLNDLYCSPNIFRVIKSRRMRWAGHVARMVERRGAFNVFLGRPE